MCSIWCLSTCHFHAGGSQVITPRFAFRKRDVFGIGFPRMVFAVFGVKHILAAKPGFVNQRADITPVFQNFYSIPMLIQKLAVPKRKTIPGTLQQTATYHTRSLVQYCVFFLSIFFHTLVNIRPSLVIPFCSYLYIRSSR